MTVFKSTAYLLLASALSALPLHHSFKASTPVVAQSAIAQEEQTILLCETDGTAVRIYAKGEAVLLRAYDRQRNAVLMNDTPALSGEMPNGIAYRNPPGESSLMVLASRAADACTISINNQPEEGVLLVDNRVAEATVTGTVAYRSRIALPPGAVVTVKLVDLSADTAIASETITTAGEQVPIPFVLSYRPEMINLGHRYGLQADISVDGERRWTTDAEFPVLTYGEASAADVVVVIVDGAAPDEPPVQNDGQTGLPAGVEQAVRAAATETTGAATLDIGDYSPETWSDGCLGLGGPAEGCLAAMTDGWRVEVIDPATGQSYMYRTDGDGRAVRLESSSQ